MDKKRLQQLEKKVTTKWTPEFVVSSGSLLFDESEALKSFKGIPSGSIIHYYSPQEGSFKSSMALHGLGNVQRLGHPVAYIDAECSLTNTSWAARCGVDTDTWSMVLPESGEEAFEYVEYFLEKGYKGIVVDSVTACKPSKLLTDEYGDASIGSHAKLVSRFVDRLKHLVVKHNAIVWLINHSNVHMTQMGARGYKPTGGSRINFYSKLNVEMKKTKSDNQLEGEDIIPLSINVKRSKFGNSYIDVPTYAIQGVGIDNSSELVILAERQGIIWKAGSWWKDNEGNSIGQGIESAREWCMKNKEKII